MKKSRQLQDRIIISMLAITILFTFSVFSSSLFAANSKNVLENKEVSQSIPELKKGMYLVVESFNILDNAVKYAKSVTIDGKSPRIGTNQGTGFYYVYGYSTKDDLEFARKKRAELRATKQFYDTWILYVGISLADFEKKEVVQEVVVKEQPKEIKSEVIEGKIPEEFIPPPPVVQDQNLYNIRFNVINATTLKEVPGYITIIDAARNKAMKSVSTNQIHQVEAPKTQSKEIIALCDIFGYVIEQAKFKLDDPMSSADKSMISESGGITTIKYELARHKVGDILTMYHVYFYNNSAIMKPDSKFEINSLLDMLKENDKLKIKIHGHTNGNVAGKIIRLKEDDKNFFQVTDNNIEGVGSAKDLSKARAETIMKWLVEQGIDKKRMELKGWGGKKMIYKKHDPMAGKNVRVEIEIMKG